MVGVYSVRIQCIHGFLIFKESSPGQLSHFCNLAEIELERSGEFFTVPALVDAPRFSIAGGTYLGAPATVTYEGEPWEVMKENGLVYSFETETVVPIETIISPVQIDEAVNYYITTGMIQPGSVTDDGDRVTNYAAFFDYAALNFKYSEVGYAENP